MFNKRIQPESFDFGMPSVEIIDTYSKGLDKTAMEKRASAFDDVIEKLEPKKNRAYLHVITTGAMETYQSNRNGDSFNESNLHIEFPEPENPKYASYDSDGGLKKYHNKSYMEKAAVYQEHNSKKEEPSGEIVAARYNDDMHRGELIIAVDTNKWARRLEKKASGQNIYLSMGCLVPADRCLRCGRVAKTASEHCDHFKHHRLEVGEDGVQNSVLNDSPEFYDISGVDVPADKIAFVLRKVASGDMAKEASLEAVSAYGTRRPMLLTKAASVLSKLSKLEKRIDAMVQGDSKKDDDPEFEDDPEEQSRFIISVQKFPADEIIDATNRKGILLSPSMLFKLMAKDSDDPESVKALAECDDDSCGDCSSMMRELEDDENVNDSLLDGMFDQHFIPDLNLDNVLESFMPSLGMTNPAVGARSIRIIITGRKPKRQHKKASLRPQASEALRRTYARYLVSFAAQNDEATCMNALRKIAKYGREQA